MQTYLGKLGAAVLCMMCVMSLTPSVQAQVKHHMRIAILGDELLLNSDLAEEQRFASKLNDVISNQHRSADTADFYVIGNRGLTSQTALKYITHLQQFKPHIVIINIGYADAQRGVDIETTRSNVTQLLRATRDNGMYTMLLVPAPPQDRGTVYINSYGRMFHAAAKAYGAIHQEYFGDVIDGNPLYLLPGDELPNEKGVEMLVRSMWLKFEVMMNVMKNTGRTLIGY